MHYLKRMPVLMIMLLLVGCSRMTAIKHIPKADNDKPIKLAVFLDGTANDEGSHTNIAKLHNLASLQPSRNIRTCYLKGVGTDGKVIGMAMGWGIGHDVREAYLFLAENYDHERGDQIFLFGFSRGAFAARILAALIFTAGIPDVSEIDGAGRYDFMKKIYQAFKGKKSLAQRREAVSVVIGLPPVPRKIEFLGLWDTVEALGVPDYEEDWELPNSRYEDQLCNIKKAAHAVSVDDDRARIFTPILLTSRHLISECRHVDIDAVVDEVWFSGAHSDVGGGYLDTTISGVSLNWMLKKIALYNIVPDDAEVYSDYLDKTHDPEAGLWGLIYRKRNRNLFAYARLNDYNANKLKLHRSVIDRLKDRGPRGHEFQWADSGYKDCFVPQGEGLRYIETSGCFAVID